MLAPIATAHLYGAGKFENVWKFSNPYFSFQKQIFFTIISSLSKNEQKLNVGSQKKNQDFCPPDMESTHLALQGAWNYVR